MSSISTWAATTNYKEENINAFFLIAGRVVVLNLTLFDRVYSKLCIEMYHQTKYEYNFVKIASGSSYLKT